MWASEITDSNDSIEWLCLLIVTKWPSSAPYGGVFPSVSARVPHQLRGSLLSCGESSAHGFPFFRVRPKYKCVYDFGKARLVILYKACVNRSVSFNCNCLLAIDETNKL